MSADKAAGVVRRTLARLAIRRKRGVRVRMVEASGE
jgi:hypothetical protein